MAGGEQTYQIRFPFQIGDGVFGQCKLFVDPKRGFAVVREENFYEGAIFFSVDYSEFKEIDSTPYPTRIKMTEYQKTKLTKQTTIEVKGAIFNVTFPSDFFTVDRKASPYQDVLEISTVPLISKSQQTQQPSTQQTAPLDLCGPLSLQFVFKQFGIKTELDELLKLTGYQEGIGTSMQGLYNAAQAKGLNPQGILVKSKKLEGISLPIIVYVAKNHFVVVKNFSNKEVDIFDPASTRRVVPMGQFKSVWDGHLLTFTASPGPTVPSVTPEIKADELTHEFGRVRGGEQVEHIFSITNTSDRPLEISRTDSSCGCTTALLSAPIVPPGEELRLKVQWDVPKGDGNTEQLVRLHTKEPNPLTFEFKVQATIYVPLKTIPERVYFSKVLPNTSATRTVDIEYLPENVKILGVRTSSEILEAIFLDGGKHLEIRVMAQRPGLINEKVFIDYLDLAAQLTLEIPINGKVMGDFEILPEKVFFGVVKQQSDQLYREVTITPNRPNLEVVRVECQSENISVDMISPKGAGQYTLRIFLQPGKQKFALLKDVIKVYTNSSSQKELEIPVFAQIAGAK